MENEVGQTASALRTPRAAIKARSPASPGRRPRWAGLSERHPRTGDPAAGFRTAPRRAKPK